ncbi:MAG: hypothetical protein H7066_14625 [Cytophagaceae bacterium]|nr:hypothetical protein [Gemmatimonadaceae bacterium]
MRWYRRPSLSYVFVAMLSVIAACGEDGSAPQPTEFSLTMNPGVATARQGETVLVNAVATITSGPASEFTFSATGAPNGVTVTFPPGPFPAASLGSASATMALQVGAAVPAGVYTLTVTATSKAGVAKTAAVSLTVTLPPSFTLSVAPTSQTINQSGSGGGVVTLVRTNFTAPVTLTFEDAPPGVTGTFTPTQVTGNSSILQIAVAPTVTLGTYNALIRAQSPGMTDRTTPMTVTIGAEPAFTLALAPTALTITPGASATSDVTVARTNYTQGISFAFESAVPGISGGFVPGATTGSASVLTVSVAANVAPGAYVTTVRATGAGVAARTATLTVTVALPTPGYTMTATPAALTVEAGQSGTSAIALARANFTGAVALALVNPPAGITGTFNPASTSTNASQLTLNVATSVTPAVYTLSARGTATGLTDRTIPITLTVTAAPQSVSLVSAPESLFVFQGAQSTSTLTITRNNYAGDVTLAVTGAPAGMTVSIAPNPVSATTSVLTVTASVAVPAGRHVLTVTASGTGITNATRTVAVNVTAGGTGSLQFTFCDPARLPVFFAYQDSTGTWTPVAPLTAGTVTKYFFELVSDRGGVAFITKRTVTTPRVAAGFATRRNRLLQAATVQQQNNALRVAPRTPALARQLAFLGTADVYDTFVYYLAKSEMNTLGQDLCTTVTDTRTNLVNVAGVGAGQLGTISLGGVNQSFIGGVTTSPLTFTGVPVRTVDLVGTRYSNQGFEKGIVLRNLNVANGATLGTTADFDGPNAFVPAVAQANIANTLGQTMTLNSIFLTANGEAGLFGIDAAPSTASARIWSGVPASRFVGTDLHALLAIASPGPGTDFRSLLQYVGPVANTNMTMGPEMDLVAVTPVGVLGDPRYRVTATTLPVGINNAVELFVNLPTLTGNSYRLLATKQYLTNSGVFSGFDLTMPPLAAVTGFPAASRLTAGTNDVRVSGLGWTGTGITAPRPQVGDQLRIATRGSTVVVP